MRLCTRLSICLLIGNGLALIAKELPLRVHLGGETTVFATNKHAFGRSAANLPVERLRDFAFGNSIFNTEWIAAPASVTSLDGLGPLYNRSSCSGCHVRDGRGRPPLSPDEMMTSMLVRLSVPGNTADGAPKPHPVYGSQLQDRALPGVHPEGRVQVTFNEVSGQFDDGTTYTLFQPEYEFKALAYGPLDDVLYSPRVAPPVYGMGLLEAIPEATILAAADPNDTDGDGISGRPNYVWDVTDKQEQLGRFGWKANQPSIRQQAAGAANGDIGLTTSLLDTDHVTDKQPISTPHGGTPELSDMQLDKLVFYLRTLAVPARRNHDDVIVLHGETLFGELGCANCHTSSLQTGAHPIPQLVNQHIFPYTDLLLHDMGDELADNRPDFQATGREWRTPPLWGLGLGQVVNGYRYLLHDGRARSIMEAIMWHGGEGAASRNRVKALSATDRDALIRFLESL